MDPEEFKTKVFPLKNRLFRLAKGYLENADDAQDIVQEVFVKLWVLRGKLAEYHSVEALAVVTARNLCLDKLKAKKHTVMYLDEISVDTEEKKFGEKTDQLLIVTRIRQIISTLPEQQRLVIHLRDIEGYEMHEITGMLGMTENTIRANLSRARKKVREQLVKEKLYEFHRN
jgi:RNA polymerase sigma factor (sigma-70 family)